MKFLKQLLYITDDLGGVFLRSAAGAIGAAYGTYLWNTYIRDYVTGAEKRKIGF